MAKKKPDASAEPKAKVATQYRILRPFTDVHTGADYVQGDAVEFTGERAAEIRGAVGEGWIEDIASDK